MIVENLVAPRNREKSPKLLKLTDRFLAEKKRLPVPYFSLVSENRRKSFSFEEGTESEIEMEGGSERQGKSICYI